MTHSSLLRAFSYLGFRASRITSSTNSVAVFPSAIPIVVPQKRTQSVGDRLALWQLLHYVKGESRYPLLIVARRGAPLSMGQASSFVRGYSAADGNANEIPKEEIHSANVSNGETATEKSKEEIHSANVSNGETATEKSKEEVVSANGDGERQDEQKSVAGEVASIESIPEVVVSPALTSQLASEDGVANKPGQTEDVMKEAEEKEAEEKEAEEKEAAKKEAVEKEQAVLNLELELGEPPERPLPDDCCGQGCDICVWDTYNDSLRDYLSRKKELLAKSK